MAINNSINNACLNGFTANGGDINISTDSAAANINVGTGAAVKVTTIGSSDTTSTTNINSGSGGVQFDSFINIPNTDTTSTFGEIKMGGVPLIAAINHSTYLGLDAGHPLASSNDYNTLVGDRAGYGSTTSSTDNVGIGYLALGNTGARVRSGAQNIAIGNYVLGDLTTGANNVSLGFSSMQGLTEGANNVSAGIYAFEALTTGNNNSSLGAYAFQTLTTGSNNIGIGTIGGNNGVGLDYTSNESWNILLNAEGVIGDQHTLRVENTTSTFMTGIKNVNVGNTVKVLTMDPAVGSAHTQIGTADIVAGTGISITAGTNTITVANTVAGGIVTIDGDSGSVTGSTVTVTGGTSGAVFTGSGTTLTESFNFLALPSTTSTNGQIKINGDTVFSAPNGNSIFVGPLSGHLAVSGINNVALGNSALTSVTTGQSNIAIGVSSGGIITSGASNTCVGGGSGLNLSTGSFNVAVGGGALSGSGAQSSNVAVGYNAIGFATNSGANNTALGYEALQDGGAGSGNVCLGYSAGAAVQGGSLNVYVGRLAGSNSSGSNNVAIGNEALGDAFASGDNNVCVGDASGAQFTTATQNVGIGHESLGQLTAGTDNLALGVASGINYTGSESSNVLLNNAGVLGESNVCRIGSGTGTGPLNLNEVIFCGINGITVTGSAVLVSSADQLGVAVSSKRFKDNIEDMNDFSSNILKLRPVTFNYNVGDDHSIQSGLIAEEVEEVMPSLMIYDKEELPQTVKYHDLPALILNELQKALKRIDALEKQINGK